MLGLNSIHVSKKGSLWAGHFLLSLGFYWSQENRLPDLLTMLTSTYWCYLSFVRQNQISDLSSEINHNVRLLFWETETLQHVTVEKGGGGGVIIKEFVNMEAWTKLPPFRFIWLENVFCRKFTELCSSGLKGTIKSKSALVQVGPTGMALNGWQANNLTNNDLIHRRIYVSPVAVIGCTCPSPTQAIVVSIPLYLQMPWCPVVPYHQQMNYWLSKDENIIKLSSDMCATSVLCRLIWRHD